MPTERRPPAQNIAMRASRQRQTPPSQRRCSRCRLSLMLSYTPPFAAAPPDIYASYGAASGTRFTRAYVCRRAVPFTLLFALNQPSRDLLDVAVCYDAHAAPQPCPVACSRHARTPPADTADTPLSWHYFRHYYYMSFQRQRLSIAL